jgi:hypothetical protein
MTQWSFEAVEDRWLDWFETCMWLEDCFAALVTITVGGAHREPWVAFSVHGQLGPRELEEETWPVGPHGTLTVPRADFVTAQTGMSGGTSDPKRMITIQLRDVAISVVEQDFEQERPRG